MKLALAATAIFCVSLNTQAQTNCNSVLQYGRLQATSSSNFLAYSGFYSAYCRDSDMTISKAKNISASLGVTIQNLPISFDGKSRDTQTKQYFESMCSSVSDQKLSKDDRFLVIESIDAKVVEAFNSCINQTGMHAWSEVDPTDRNLVWLYFKYVPGAGSATSLKLQKPFTVTPSAALTECSSRGAAGETVFPNTPLESACVVSPEFMGKNVAVTFFPKGAATKTLRVSLPPAAPAVPPGITPTPITSPLAVPRHPSLVMSRSGRTETALLGEWLEIPVGPQTANTVVYGPGSPVNANTVKAYDLAVQGFSLGVFDPSATFPSSAKLAGGMRVTTAYPGGSTSTFVNPRPIPIWRDAILTGIDFAGFNWTVKHSDKTIQWAVTPVLMLDASLAGNFGIESKLSGAGGCLGAITSVPSKGMLELKLPTPAATAANPTSCTLMMRLCTLSSHALDSTPNRCSAG